MLTQNKHKIIISGCSQAWDAPERAVLSEIGGVGGKKVSHKTTLVGQDDSAHASNSIA